MKIKVNSLSILCAIFMCSACGNSAVNSKTAQIASDSVPTITIRLPDIDSLENLYLSEIADSVYYVALSERPILEGDYLCVETTDSVMVIGPTEWSRGDLMRLYDLNGNFKRNIGGVGRGSGEYIRPKWCIISNTNRAYIYTHINHKSLQTYGLSCSNLNMISKSKNDIFHGNIYKILPAGDNIVIASDIRASQIQPELILYNLKTNTIIDSLPNYYIPKGGVDTYYVGQIETAFSEYKNELYSMSVYSDTLYRVTEKEILPFVIFEKEAELLGIMRTSNMLYVQFLQYKKRRRVEFIYALNLSNFTGRYCKGHFINDLDNGPNYGVLHTSLNPNQTIDVATLKTMLDDQLPWVKDRLFPDNKMPKKLKDVDEFQRLWDKSTENSNPIIQFFKLK